MKTSIFNLPALNYLTIMVFAGVRPRSPRSEREHQEYRSRG